MTGQLNNCPNIYYFYSRSADMRVIVGSMHTINMKLYKSVSFCKNTKIFIIHITSVETVKALVGLHKFKAAPEMPLLAHAFTIITWISQF